ncbi:MAG: PilZ domain-containing protein [Aureliella sp.]
MLGNSLDSAADFDVAGLANQIAAIRQDSSAFRRHERFEVSAKLRVFAGEIDPANAIGGVCCDLSRSGLGAVLTKAPPVGEEVWLIVDDVAEIDGPLHARCMRCRMLHDGSFEAGFMFFSQIDLGEDQSDASPAPDTSSLI